jgi:hypothetical protein
MGAPLTPAHPRLAAGRWFELSLVEQLANVGSEVERALRWREKGNAEFGQRAFERALELLDLTIADAANLDRLRELTRLREVLADYFWFDNEYGSTAESWRRYFGAFTYAAALRRGV